jgi:hypothetical protein
MIADERAYAKVMIEKQADLKDQVWSINVEDYDRAIDKATLVMDDPGSTNSDVLREGAFISIEMGWESERAAMFEGLITRVEASAAQGNRRVTLVAYDLSYKLQAIRDPDAKHVGTLDKILADLVKPSGIEIGKVQVEPMPELLDSDNITQGDRTNWQMIQWFAQRYHARAFVEVNATDKDSEEVRKQGGKSRFYFLSEEALAAQEPMGRLLYCPGHGQLLDFSYKRVGSGASPSTSAMTGDPATGETVEQEAPPADPEPPPVPDERHAAQAGSVIGEARAKAYVAAHDVVASAPVKPHMMRATDLASGQASDPVAVKETIKQDPTRLLGFSGDGVATGTVYMRAKGSVTIDGLATWAAGNWYVTRVNHILERTRVQDKDQLTYRIKFRVTR